MIDGNPMPPVKIDMKAMELVYPNGQTAGFKKIALPPQIRANRSRRAYGIWREARATGYRMPVDCGLADRNAVYLYSTTSLSLSQCERMGVALAAYLVEALF